MAEKKTANMKKYQAEYAKANPRDNKEYMKDYIKKAEDVECPVCKAAGTPGHYKTYAKYRHDATKKHKTAELLLEAKNELAKREKEEAEAQAKALAKQAEKKKRGETPRAPPKKKEAVVESPPEKKKVARKIKIGKKKEENIKMEVKEKPKERGETPRAPAKKKGGVGESPPKEKAAALKALEEYSSSSESEEEEEKLEDTVFYFQGKEIDAEKVAEYIEEHHESSVNPDRAPDTKTKRQNKNASLWRKVRAELDGKKWSYLGQHFGEIVSKAYDKPSSQADLIQMLKMVAIHFTKVPVGEQKAISALARKLKESHTAKSK